MCRMEPMRLMQLGLICPMPMRATMVSLTSTKQWLHHLFYCSRFLDLPHKILRNLCWSEGKFWNNETRQLTWLSLLLLWFWSSQAWQLKRYSTMRGRPNLAAIGSGTVVWIQKSTWMWIAFCFWFFQDGRFWMVCLEQLLISMQQMQQPTEMWKKACCWRKMPCLYRLSRLTIASPLWLSMLSLLNRFLLLKLRAQMPTMQRHGMNLLVLKILELLPQESEPY